MNFNQKIEEYYIKIKKNIGAKINTDIKYNYKFYSNDNANIIEIYNNNNDNIILKAEYSILGVYNIAYSTWYWAWNSNMINKTLIKDSLLIKKISKDVIQNISPKDAEELYFYTNNGNFFISSDNILKLIKIGLYITNANWYIPIIHNDPIDKIEYILIKKILQYS